MRVVLRRHPVIALIALVVVGLLVWGFWPRAVLVEGVAARRAPLTITIEEEGRTRVVDRYVVSAPVDGVTCRVQLDVGDPVEKGQTLLNISPLESKVLDHRSRSQAEAQVAAAESALRAAEEDVRAAASAEQLAANELERLRPLIDRGVISRDAFDKALTTAQTTSAATRSAEFNVEVASYELESARSVLERSAGGPRANDAAGAGRVAHHLLSAGLDRGEAGLLQAGGH